MFEKTKINKKEAGVGPFLKKRKVKLTVFTNYFINQKCSIKVFFKWAIPGLLSLFSFFQYTVDSKQMFYINKFLPMTGFEPRTSGIGSDRSTNWATTTALIKVFWCHNSKSIGSLGQKCHQILGQHHSCLLKLWRLSSL